MLVIKCDAIRVGILYSCIHFLGSLLLLTANGLIQEGIKALHVHEEGRQDGSAGESSIVDVNTTGHAVQVGAATQGDHQGSARVTKAYSGLVISLGTHFIIQNFLGKNTKCHFKFSVTNVIWYDTHLVGYA